MNLPDPFQFKTMILFSRAEFLTLFNMGKYSIVDSLANVKGFTVSRIHQTINVNNLQDRSDVNQVYDQVRLSWRLSPAKARQADYVLAVVKGVIVGAFVADEWMKATPSNFPELHVSRTDESRWGFKGGKAPDDVWSRFVGDRGKRIDDAKMRHKQNPIRYWNI